MSGFDLNSSSGKTFKTLPAGNHDAVLLAIVAMGEQENKYDKNQKPKHLLKFIFEVPGELQEDGTTCMISKNAPATAHEKATLVKWFKVLLGKADENTVKEYLSDTVKLKSLLGKACTLTIATTEDKGDGKKSYSYVESVGQLDPRLPQPSATRKTFLFNPKDDSAESKESFVSDLSKRTRDEIMSSLNVQDYADGIKKAYAKIKEAEAKENPLA